jgi:hypothetical protein
MSTHTDRNIILTVACLALCLAVASASSRPALALVISFEQSEGFPAPVLIPDPAPGGVVDPSYNFTGFAGGPNTGYPGDPNGPVPDKPNFTTDGGAVSWGVESQARTNGTWFTDDGPGGLNILLGTAPSLAPAPVSGTAVAGFGDGTLGGQGLVFEGVMHLDHSQNFQLQSFWYANRGNGPPRLQVEYYANDANETYLGMNTFALGTDPADIAPGGGGSWVGVGHNFQPQFQLIKPTAAFQGVALGKVVFRSFADGISGQIGVQNPPALTDDEANGDVPNPTGHGTFFLDDITLQPNGHAYNPNNYVHLSFEASEGFPNQDGGVIRSPTVNTAVPNVVDGFEINDTVVDTLQIDHGPGGKGNPRPASEPDPIDGSQFALSRPGANGTNEVTIDLHNASKLGLAGFYYANRGSYPPKLTVQYYDTNENLVGENVYDAGVDGGPGVGLDAAFNPKFQFIKPSEPFQNVALSKIKLISAPPNPATGSGGFAMDDFLLVPGSGAFNPGNKVRISFETSEGFPAAQGNIEGSAVPSAFIDNLHSSELPNADPSVKFVTGAYGNNPFGEKLDAVSGEQFASLTGPGSISLTIDLKNSANLSLESFWYANRGNIVPGVRVEYFGLNGASLGTESFSGSTDGGQGLGLDASYNPEFDKITVSLPAALGVPLSKVIITSTTTNPTGNASFFIDDILFSVVGALVPGDYNHDGIVDTADYVVWRETLGSTTNLVADGNGNGVVDQSDYQYWRVRFGNTSGSGSGSSLKTAVPEPASGITAMVLLSAVSFCRVRRD